MNDPFYLESYTQDNLPIFIVQSQYTGRYDLYAIPGSCMYHTWAGYVVSGCDHPFSDFDQTHLIAGSGWYLVGLTLKP